MDVKYAVTAHRLTEAHYVLTNKIIVFLQVLATSGVVAGALKQNAELSIVVGIVLGVVSAWQQASKPLSEAAKHGAAREKFALLLAKINKSGLEVAAIDAELALLYAKAPKMPRAIEFAAYNDNLQTNGRPDGMLKETWTTRFMRVLT